MKNICASSHDILHLAHGVKDFPSQAGLKMASYGEFTGLHFKKSGWIHMFTYKNTSNPSVTSSAFCFPFFSFPPPEQHWHETNIMKYHETTCNIFWEPIRRSESGFDFKGIVSSCWFLYFDVICHQTHFIDGLVVLFLWKRFSRIEAFRNCVISKCFKWTLAFHKWKKHEHFCFFNILNFRRVGIP